MQAELPDAAPGLLAITGQADNLWFLHFLTCRADLPKLQRVRPACMLKLARIGVAYAARIAAWQKTATFASCAAWSGPMIHADATRLLSLREAMGQLEAPIAPLIEPSGIARRWLTMPGFGAVCASELAAEIGQYRALQGRGFAGSLSRCGATGSQFRQAHRGEAAATDQSPRTRGAVDRHGASHPWHVALAHSTSASMHRAKPACRRYAPWRVTWFVSYSAC